MKSRISCCLNMSTLRLFYYLVHLVCISTSFRVLAAPESWSKHIIYSTLHLNFGQTQPIKVYSPRNFSHFTCFGIRIRSSYKIKFGHLNNPRFLLPWGIKLTILPKHGQKNFMQFLRFFFQQF